MKEKTTNQDVGKAIKRQRVLASMTQEQLAVKLDVKQSVIHNMETGKRSISVEEIQELAAALHCTVSELFDFLESSAKSSKSLEDLKKALQEEEEKYDNENEDNQRNDFDDLMGVGVEKTPRKDEDGVIAYRDYSFNPKITIRGGWSKDGGHFFVPKF